MDSDWCGETDTRKSTSGGAACLDDVDMKHWCVSQATVALSSAEAENKAAIKGSVEGLYISNLLRQQGVELDVVIYSDSSAAIGHCSRLGNGKRMRHLEAADLWIQQLVKSKRIQIRKINDKSNPADLFTKFLSREEIIIHKNRIGYRLFDMHGNEIGVKPNHSLSNLEVDSLVFDEEYGAVLASIFSCLVESKKTVKKMV